MSICAMRLRVRRELRRLAGDAIVEARAERDQEVAIVDRVVGERRAVHAEHAHRQRMRRVERAEAHQRRDDRDAELDRELAQRGRAVGVDHAAAGVDQRPLRLAEHREELARTARREHDAAHQAVHAMAVAAHRQPARALERAAPVLHVLRNVDDDRARAGRCARSRTPCAPSLRAWSASVTRNTCLATEPMMLATGASWNASLPIAAVGTWPQITTIGTESAMQSRTGVTVLVAPGPGGDDAHADLAASRAHSPPP